MSEQLTICFLDQGEKLQLLPFGEEICHNRQKLIVLLIVFVRNFELFNKPSNVVEYIVELIRSEATHAKHMKEIH